MKLLTMLVSIYTTPSLLSRETAVTVWVSSSRVLELMSSPVADTPSRAHRAETRMIPRVNSANRVMGWGKRLPALSMPPSIRPNRDGLSFLRFLAMRLPRLPIISSIVWLISVEKHAAHKKTAILFYPIACWASVIRLTFSWAAIRMKRENGRALLYQEVYYVLRHNLPVSCGTAHPCL